jgi:OmpA-OmpF porin, OOP family
MKTIGWLAGAALMIAAQCASAQGMERWYVGASAGKSDIDSSVADGLITSGTVDGKDSGTKLYGGYRFGRNLAVELAWVDLGGADYSGSFFATPVTGGRVKVSGLNSSIVGIFPATSQFELFAKAGIYSWEANASDTTGGAPFSGKINGSNASFGLGASYYFSKNVGARLEWEHFELDPGSAALLSAGLIVRF